MALAVQAIVGAMGNGAVLQNVTPGAVGAAVTSGNLVVGACVYFNGGTLGTDYLSSITDNQGNTYNLLDHTTTIDTVRYMTTFYKFNITNAPTTITGNFSATEVTASQIIWLEYSKIYANIHGHGGLGQDIPGTGANVITSGVVPTGNGPVVGFSMQRNGTLTEVVGTNYTLEVMDGVSGDWGLMAEDLLGTHLPLAATFTDATNGAASGQKYISSVIALSKCGSSSLALMGVGCGIALAKKLEENPILARRSLILPPWRR